MSRIHVRPVADLISHQLIGERCDCGPRLEGIRTPAGVTTMVVHNSLDGRERFEPEVIGSGWTTEFERDALRVDGS